MKALTQVVFCAMAMATGLWLSLAIGESDPEGDIAALLGEVFPTDVGRIQPGHVRLLGTLLFWVPILVVISRYILAKLRRLEFSAANSSSPPPASAPVALSEVELERRRNLKYFGPTVHRTDGQVAVRRDEATSMWVALASELHAALSEVGYRHTSLWMGSSPDDATFLDMGNEHMGTITIYHHESEQKYKCFAFQLRPAYDGQYLHYYMESQVGIGAKTIHDQDDPTPYPRVVSEVSYQEDQKSFTAYTGWSIGESKTTPLGVGRRAGSGSITKSRQDNFAVRYVGTDWRDIQQLFGVWHATHKDVAHIYSSIKKTIELRVQALQQRSD